nr:zinc finger, CCHC-type [Tanacetum cinerariifolium]
MDRLVIQGFRQKEGIDYFDTYAPVARITTIRLLLGLAAIHNLVIHQMDVKTSFLNGDLDEKVYMKQPEGFVMRGIEHKVCKLVKSFKKILKKFNREDFSPVRTPMDLVEKLKPNTGKPVDQLEYSRAFGFLMYAMTSTRPYIAYDVGRLSRFTNAISWASKKQLCITGSTMESEFLALTADGLRLKDVFGCNTSNPDLLRNYFPIARRTLNARWNYCLWLPHLSSTIKEVAEMLHASVLELSHDVEILHAAVTGKDRDLMVHGFNKRFIQVLITTDALLPPEFDQSMVNVVINWEMPRVCDSLEEEEPDVALYSQRFCPKGAVFNFLCGARDNMVMNKFESRLSSNVSEASTWASTADFKMALEEAGLI